MIVPLMLPAIYTSVLIFGPAFMIILAISLVLLARFPSLSKVIGFAMVVVGLVEFSLVPAWVLWVFSIGLVTMIVGVIAIAYGLLGKKESLGTLPLYENEGVGIGLVAVVIGLLIIAVFWYSVWGFALGLSIFAFGTAGAAALLPEHRRVKTGFALAIIGVAVILAAVLTGFLALAFFVGLVVVFAGVSMGISGFLCYSRKGSGGNTLRRLKKYLYMFLAIVIFSSSLVLSLRTTHVLREELYDEWRLETTADTTVRGVITEISLNREVNSYGYSYHIFPALIIVNVTEVVEVGESWMNLTELSEHWVNENLTVAYDKSDVPDLSLGELVETSGYYDTPIEDSWSYSHKLIIATEVHNSYIKPL